MQADIEFRMLPRNLRHLRDPRARHHDAGRLHGGGEQRLGGRHVHRMAHAGIVGVDHQELRVRTVSQALGRRFGGSGLSERGGCHAGEKGASSHAKIIRAVT